MKYISAGILATISTGGNVFGAAPPSCGNGGNSINVLDVDLLAGSTVVDFDIKGLVDGSGNNLDVCCGVEDVLTGGNGGSSDICRTSGMGGAGVAGYCESTQLFSNRIPCPITIDDFDVDSSCNHTMTMELSFMTDNSFSDKCCKSCTCFGDPVCISYEGAKDEWVVCDGRYIIGEGTPGEKCRQGRTECKNQTDHDGRSCVWVPDVQPGYTPSDGSRCQANWALSGYPTMKMYTKPGFDVELTLGDLGFIIGVQVNEFKLDVGKCFQYDPRTDSDSSFTSLAWSPSSIPAGWTVSPKPNDIEIKWEVVVDGVYMQVTCSQDTHGNKRMNIDHLTETNDDVTDGEGFCVSGVISDKKGSTEKSKELHPKCRALHLTDEIKVCKGIFGEECNPISLNHYINTWCEDADLNKIPGVDVAACKTTLLNENKDVGEQWVEWICMINSLDVEQCKNAIEEDGWETFFLTNSDGMINSGNPIVTCELDVRNYPTTKQNKCDKGVSVEYYNATIDEWVMVFFVPELKPPCGGSLSIPEEGAYLALFNNPVRYTQCGLDEECSVKNACEPAFKFIGSFKYTTSCEFDETIPPEPECECEYNNNTAPAYCVEGTNSTEYPGFHKLVECGTCCSQIPELPDGTPETCRELPAQDAFCNYFDPAMKEKCDALTEDDSTKVTFQFTYDESANDMFCCKTCTCFGDPQCLSFYDEASEKQHSDVWLLCESRDPSEETDCFTPLESECSNYKDHKGNQCVWDQDRADALIGRYVDIPVIGSPCQPNWEVSGEATMVMYSFNGFEALLSMGERGVIEELRLESEGENVALIADKCFEADPYAAWGGKTKEELEQLFDFLKPSGDFDERVWKMRINGIYLQVACIRRYSRDGKSSAMRLNVEKLMETDKDRIGGGEGFCVSGAIDKQLDTTYNTELFERCHETQDSLVNVCRALWSESCTKNTDFERSAKEWCEKANVFVGDANRVQKCVNFILKTNSEKKIAEAWIELYCEAIKGSFDGTTAECRSSADDIISLVKSHGYGFQGTECATSWTQYSTSGPGEGECNDGFTIQVRELGGTIWEDILYIPSHFPPCGGKLELFAKDFPDLFIKQFQVKQCYGNDDTCETETQCKSAAGFDVYYQFSYDTQVCEQRLLL